MKVSLLAFKQEVIHSVNTYLMLPRAGTAQDARATAIQKTDKMPALVGMYTVVRQAETEQDK